MPGKKTIVNKDASFVLGVTCFLITRTIYFQTQVMLSENFADEL
jgi:hypothetical protein